MCKDKSEKCPRQVTRAFAFKKVIYIEYSKKKCLAIWPLMTNVRLLEISITRVFTVNGKFPPKAL